MATALIFIDIDCLIKPVIGIDKPVFAGDMQFDIATLVALRTYYGIDPYVLVLLYDTKEKLDTDAITFLQTKLKYISMSVFNFVKCPITVQASTGNINGQRHKPNVGLFTDSLEALHLTELDKSFIKYIADGDKPENTAFAENFGIVVTDIEVFKQDAIMSLSYSNKVNMNVCPQCSSKHVHFIHTYVSKVKTYHNLYICKDCATAYIATSVV